jgi:PAS domain S-box-containing protein
MTLGRSFLLWLLGVLVVTMIVVSALVLWHEQRILEADLRSRAELTAQVLALAAADGGSPEYLTVFSMTDMRAGEVRDREGAVLWRFGPSPAEAESLDTGLMRVERRVQVARGPWIEGGVVDVVLLVSRARIRANLAVAAVNLLTGLGIAMTLALVAGLALIGRVVRPLHQLSDWVRTFNPDQPADLPAEGGTTAEVRELAGAFREMASRLADQQRSLVASEHRFRELFTASPTPLLRLDRDLCLRDANTAAETYLGGEAARSTGKSLVSFLEKPPSEEVEEAVQRTAEGRETTVEARWRLADGEVAEVELRLGWIGDDETAGFLAAIHDLTDRVRRMGERWRRTFDAMVDGVALVDSDGRIVLANQALEPHVTSLGKEVSDRLGGGAPPQWRTHNLGRLLDCSLTMPEGLRHAVFVVRDVTEAADAEERLRDAEKMQAVGTLASGVAHDFNNLLAAVLLHARLVQRQPETAADSVAAIRDLAEQGTEVVRELLLFARRQSSPPSTLDLVELVHLQEGVLRHLVSPDVELEFILDEEPVPVVGDAVGLRRMLVNLVLNARDAVDPKGGHISVRVELTAGRAVLEIADDGPGIDPEVREHLFEPFFTQRRQGRGAGLGLAVVYGIASAHGGDVDVRSAPGEGARFRVRMPLGDAALIEPIEGRAPTPTTGARVLLVEPDGRSAARLVEELAGGGLDVRHAPSADVAVDLATEWAPKVVMVSGLGGTDTAAERLRRLQLPVLLLGESPPADLAVWGPRAVPLANGDDLEAIAGALRDLGVVAE